MENVRAKEAQLEKKRNREKLLDKKRNREKQLDKERKREKQLVKERKREKQLDQGRKRQKDRNRSGNKSVVSDVRTSVLTNSESSSKKRSGSALDNQLRKKKPPTDIDSVGSVSNKIDLTKINFSKSGKMKRTKGK